MQADKDRTLRKLKTVRGQIDGLMRMVEEDRYCIDLSTQLMASTAILNNINRDILFAHLEHCVKSALSEGSEGEKAEKIEEIERVIEILSK